MNFDYDEVFIYMLLIISVFKIRWVYGRLYTFKLPKVQCWRPLLMRLCIFKWRPLEPTYANQVCAILSLLMNWQYLLRHPGLKCCDITNTLPRETNLVHKITKVLNDAQ